MRSTRNISQLCENQIENAIELADRLTSELRKIIAALPPEEAKPLLEKLDEAENEYRRAKTKWNHQ